MFARACVPIIIKKKQEGEKIMYKSDFTINEFEKIIAFQEQTGEQDLQNKGVKKSFSDISFNDLCDVLHAVYGDSFDAINIRPGIIKDGIQTFLATTVTHGSYESASGETLEEDMFDYLTLTPTTLSSMNYDMSDKDIEIYKIALAQKGY